ncbi:hypothetical protein L1987_55440 [Smallanthus sonchifolius]|uniref:Uncharacterized protein n=1 Tax=Smallanthus sonchifolius TaxID=185202 RepID=A0ACB9EAB6_9ASTR|nr:hypothetical protein L1987_55440 [Smallanthus sonchifolius]
MAVIQQLLANHDVCHSQLPLHSVCHHMQGEVAKLEHVAYNIVAGLTVKRPHMIKSGRNMTCSLARHFTYLDQLTLKTSHWISGISNHHHSHSGVGLTGPPSM